MEDFEDEAGNSIEAQAERNEFEALMEKSVQEILRDGQKALFARLVSRCRLGLATHQEQAILRNVLKDNGLIFGIPPEKADNKDGMGHNGGPPLDLPVYGDPDE